VAAAHDVGVLSPITVGTKAFLGWATKHWPVWGGLVFPLKDPMGSVTGFQVRLLPDQLEAGQNAYSDFQVSRAHPRAFGMHEALPAVWLSQRVVLVEGVFDYFGVRAAGAPDVIANLTANVAGPMRRFLGRYAKLVVALLDTDLPGRAAAFKLQQMGTFEGFVVSAPVYPAKDAGALLQIGQTNVLTDLLSRHVVQGTH